MLVTVLAISVTNILYLLTLALGTNIQKMSPRSQFCRQHSKIVTNYKSPTSQCHQHDCSPKNLYIFKVGCVFPMVLVSILPHAEFGRNDHRENAPHFIILPHLLSTTVCPSKNATHNNSAEVKELSVNSWALPKNLTEVENKTDCLFRWTNCSF